MRKLLVAVGGQGLKVLLLFQKQCGDACKRLGVGIRNGVLQNGRFAFFRKVECQFPEGLFLPGVFRQGVGYPHAIGINAIGDNAQGKLVAFAADLVPQLFDKGIALLDGGHGQHEVRKL